MRVAIIDLGTNSVRFDVHQIGPGNRVRKLHREKLMVRLGQGVFSEGKLDRNAIRRTHDAFASFKRTAQDLGAGKILAFGTSALREAADTTRFLNIIRERTGIDVRVISGQEEAKLIAAGILANEKATKGPLGLIDIGGGSTEISICRNKKMVHSESFPLGTARLQQVFLKSSPPKAPTRKGEIHPIELLRRYIKSVVLPKMISEHWPKKTARIMGSSGTIRALAKILRKTENSKSIELKELQKLVKAMSGMTTTQLLGIPGMESKRVDMILAGAILLEECMIALGAKKALTTEFSLRDGILEEEKKLFSQHKASHISFHLEDLYARARKFDQNDAHLRQVVASSEALYDRLKRVHKLKSEWKTYLTAAAILHDTGQAVSPTRHEIHSYYIVKNADFPSMEKWEAEFVALLCLHHQGGKVEAKDLPFETGARKSAFLKLLAILRIADALDRGHKNNSKIRELRIAAKTVRITLSNRNGVDLELLRVEQKKALFEQVFRKQLLVEKS